MFCLRKFGSESIVILFLYGCLARDARHLGDEQYQGCAGEVCLGCVGLVLGAEAC